VNTDPHQAPDILFHRELVELGKYPGGKQDLDFLPDYSRTLFADIQARMNDRFSAQNVELRTRFGFDLYFDFINSGSPNALAFKAGMFAMVGVTRGMLDHLVLFSGRLAKDPRFATVLGIPAIPEAATDSSIVTLFGMAVQFFTAHEIGHHVHGHVNFGAASGAPHLFEFVDANDTKNHIDLQAMEIDADAYAISSMLPHVLGEQLDDIARGLGMEKKSLPAETVLTLVLIAIVCFLHTLPQRRYTEATVQSLRHPPRLARLNYILGNIQRWCRLRRPALQDWPSLEQFQKIGQLVTDCSGVSPGGMSWAEEDNFLPSEDGTKYIRNLDEALSRVAEQMKPFAWQ
jgi:hypothetical protein